MSTPRRTSNRLKALSQGHVCDKDTLAVDASKALPASLLVIWGSRRLVVRRQPDYAATIASVTSARTMKGLKESSFHFEAIVPEHGEEMCEITDDAWSDTVWSLRSVTVVLDEAAVRPTLGIHPTPGHIVPATPTNHPYYLYVKTLDRKTLTIVCNPHDSVESVKGKIQDQEGICVRKQRLISSGQELRDDKRTLQSYNIRTGYTLHLINRLMGGKPVIYILSPITLEDISVSLALTAGWSFTTLYPNTTVVSEEHKETVHWVVDASPDGTLLDRRSSLQISYLFWEAETHPALAPPEKWAPSRPACPCCDALVKFDPSRPSLTPEHAVLLSADEVAMYLDHALKALTLNTEARTSFITYWLPSLLKHQNIALRFLPQNVYEAAAPMDITPVPDVVTRVFMLFRGVEEEDLEKWAQAKMRADYSDVSFWTNIIGIDVEKASNESLYRVLEWGGMEIR